MTSLVQAATRYDKILVRFGPMRFRYKLNTVKRAIATRVPMGPALSFANSWDMIYIEFGTRAGRMSGLPLAISPADKAAFLRELGEKVPGLEIPVSQPGRRAGRAL